MKCLLALFPLNVWFMLWHTHAIVLCISELPILSNGSPQQAKMFYRVLWTVILLLFFFSIHLWLSNMPSLLQVHQCEQSLKVNWIPGCNKPHSTSARLVQSVFAFVVKSSECFFFYDWIWSAWGLSWWGFCCVYLLSADFLNALYLIYSLLLLPRKLSV